MIRSVFGMCVVLCVTTASYAQQESSLETTAQKIAKLEARKDALAKVISETKNRSESSFLMMKKATDNLKAGGTLGTLALTSEQRDLYLKAKKDNDKLQAEANPALDKLKSEAIQINSELDKLKGVAYRDKLQSTATEAVQAVREQARVTNDNNVLLQKLRVADLRMGLSELNFELHDTDKILNEMEKIYDKSVLGAYLQDKMGQLLNSQVICSAVKRCGVSDPKMIDSQRIRNEIFPEAPAVRGDYYEKVNKKKATPVQ